MKIEIVTDTLAPDVTGVAMMVGRVAAEKNFDLAITVFERMRHEVPDVRCVVVGDGPPRAGLAERHPWLRFTGMKTGEELAKHYASADVLVFPSETETFGNVLLEGMASGLATVSYDYAAAALHVSHRENGLKVAKGDGAEFIRHALAALALKPGDDLRHAARATAELLCWDQVVGQLEARLEEIAGASRRASKPAAAGGKRTKLEYRTVFLSDLHLGTPDSKADEVVDFLKRIRCQQLVLNGDIIDGWALKRGARWTSRHSRVIRRILKMTERDKTEVIYLRGNHDEILERFMPLAFDRVRHVKEHIHTTPAGWSWCVTRNSSPVSRWMTRFSWCGGNDGTGAEDVFSDFRSR